MYALTALLTSAFCDSEYFDARFLSGPNAVFTAPTVVYTTPTAHAGAAALPAEVVPIRPAASEPPAGGLDLRAVLAGAQVRSPV